MLLGMNQTSTDKSSKATAASGEKLTTWLLPRPTRPPASLCVAARVGARKTIQARLVAAKVSATDATCSGKAQARGTARPRKARRKAWVTERKKASSHTHSME